MTDMKTKHTPGPWFYRPEEPSVEAQTKDGYNFYVAKCPESYSDAVPLAVAQANARLIAACPELLSALQVAVATIERLASTPAKLGSVQGTLSVARAALAKALTP